MHSYFSSLPPIFLRMMSAHAVRAGSRSLSLSLFFFQVEERREAVVAGLVRYLGPEAASFIHYEEKVSKCLADLSDIP